MSERAKYHVSPHENGWQVKKEKASRPARVCGTKEEAIEEAKRIAKNNPLGQVIIHKKDGTIQTEYTYGKDPRKSPG